MWRMEHSYHSFDVTYRPGNKKEKSPLEENQKLSLLSGICGRNYQLAYVLRWNETRFYRLNSKVIKATQPYEGMTLDFKSPLLSKTPYKYMLTITDEYSWYPFVIPCPEVSSTMIILCSFFRLRTTRAYSFGQRCFIYVRTAIPTRVRVGVSRTNPFKHQDNDRY